MKTILIWNSLLLALLLGCRNDPAGPNDPTPVPAVVKAVYILNEGDFSDATGARLTLYDTQKDSVYTNIFESANGGAHLGNVGDDMRFYNGRAYIVMSGSKNLVVMNLTTHRKEAEMTFPGSATHDLVIDSVRNKIFVTRLFSRSLFVLNLSTLAIQDSISVGANPQGMVIANGKLFVCNSGYGSDSTVSVINQSTNQLITTVKLAHGPTNAAVAADGKVWVACTGNAFATPATKGKIFIIDPATNLVADSISFADNLWGTISIGSDGFAYVIGITPSSFNGGPVHKISTATKAVVLNYVPGTFYGLAFDDVAREVYAADVRNFSGNGEVKIYTTAGALRKTFVAQKGPAVFGFKR